MVVLFLGSAEVFWSPGFASLGCLHVGWFVWVAFVGWRIVELRLVWLSRGLLGVLGGQVSCRLVISGLLRGLRGLWEFVFVDGMWWSD